MVYISNILQDICAQSWLSITVLRQMYLSSFKTRNQILHFMVLKVDPRHFPHTPKHRQHLLLEWKTKYLMVFLF